jgi:hypothetical protein
MGLKRGMSEKEEYKLQYHKLFGIVDKDISKDQLGNGRVGFPIPLNHESRELELHSRLKTEFLKAQAVMLVRRNYYV